MSTIGGCNYICEAITQSLDRIANGASPLLKRTRTGTVQSLMSPMNAGERIQVDQLDGHRRAVKVVYQQRMIEDETEDTPSSTCVSTNPVCDHETDFDVALYTSIDRVVSMDDIARSCKGTGAYVDEAINGMFEAMNRRINRKSITAMLSQVGTNIATGLATPTVSDIYDNATGAVNTAVWNTWWDQLINSNQFSQMPIVVAGSTFFKANNTLKFSCCNNDGIDMLAASQQSGYSYFNDQMIDSVIAANRAFVYEPGAAKFVTWYKYRNLAGGILGNTGAYAAFEQADGTMQGLIADPAPGGLTYNIRVFPNTCDGTYSIFLELNHDIFVLPPDMFQVGDPLSGYNGLLYYEFT